MYSSTFRFAVLAALVGASAAQISASKGFSASFTRTAVAAYSTPTALCKANTVECCAGTTDSNSTTAAALFSAYNVTAPAKVVDLGYNCTSVTDNEVNDGYCSSYVLCCKNIYNGTETTNYNGTLGLGCSDVDVSQ